MRSYSVTALLLTTKPRQTEYTVLLSNTTEDCFSSTRSTEGRDLYLNEIISDIGEFSHLIECHGACSNNNEVSFVTKFTYAGKFQLNMNFPSLS